MPVLMIGEVPNLTEEIYAGMIGQMMPSVAGLQRVHLACRRARIQQAVGEWSRSGSPKKTARGGSTRTCDPNLPPDIVPDRQYYPLHTAFTK